MSTDEENAGVLTKKESYQKKKLQKTDISTTKKNNDRFSKESDGENDENDWKSTGKRRKDYFSNDNRDLNVINGKKDRDDNSVKKLKNRGSRMNHKEIDNGVRYKTNKNHDNADELNNTDENDDDYDDRNKVSDESDAEQEEIKSNENVLDDETKTDKEDIFNREMMMHNEKRSRKGKYIRILKEVDKKLMRNDDDSEERYSKTRKFIVLLSAVRRYLCRKKL